MLFSNILITTIAALANTAQAAPASGGCVSGVAYCGSSLLNHFGLSQFSSLIQAVEGAAGVLDAVTSPVTGLDVLQTLFSCSNGKVTVLQHCVVSCISSGPGQNDKCLATTS